MKNSNYIITAVMVLLAGIAIHAQIQAYPTAVLTPSQPVDGDDVSMRLIKGMHSNSCTPTYTAVSFDLEPSMLPVYPPEIGIRLKYIEHPGNQGPCLMVITPYGPTFKFGNLNVGSYTVFDGEDAVLRFSVAEKGSVKTHTIDGVVTEDTGPLEIFAPLEGVTVYLQMQDDIYFIDDPIIMPPEIPYRTVDSAKTDQNGHYEFSGIAGGYYRLGFVKDGYQSKYGNGWYWAGGFTLQADTTINASLLPVDAAAVVNGNVAWADCPDIGDGPCILEPVAGCSITVNFPLILMYDAVQMGSQQLVGLTAVTDREGNYTISDVPVTYSNQPVTVSAAKEGFAPASERAALYNRGIATVNFILEKSYSNSVSEVKDGIVFTVA